MRRHYLPAAILPLLLLSAPASALEDVGECYAVVEAYDQVLSEGGIAEGRAVALDAALGAALSACEAGDLAGAEARFAEAQALYAALDAPPGGTAGVSDADFWQLADYMWGNRSYRKGVDVLQFHMTGDGDPDFIGSLEDRDNPDGPFFQVLVVSRPAGGGDLQYGFVSLPYNRETQVSLCRFEDGATATALRHRQLGPEELAAFSIPVSANAAEIDDSMCDTLRLLWPLGAMGYPEDGLGMRVDLILDRN